MKKILHIIGLTLGFLVIIFIGLRVIWSFKEKKVLSIYILDKTVSSNDRPEHKSFTWILKNARYVLPNQKSYNSKKDYYGFFPIDINNGIFDFKSVRINEVNEFAEAHDIAYYTDCYGVHSFEWYKGKAKPIRSQKVFGGLNQNDYLLMRNMLDSGKLVLAEYNMFSTPTNALVRSKTEVMLGISWSGWSGKYFKSLDIENAEGPPAWMKNLYESQHMGTWPNDKSGIVLLNNDGIIELMITDNHVKNPLPKIITNKEACERFGVAPEINYENWFEFINPLQNKVHSNYTIEVTQKGEELLSRIGLSSKFPAIIEGSGPEKFFYFCGDFAENPSRMWTAKLAGANQLNYFLNRFNNSNRAKFFRYYYTPLINSIIYDYYRSLEK